jgi:hypothetical protein
MAALVAVSATSSANAAIAYDQDLAAPGVYYGAGNDGSPQHFTVNTAGGVEIALRSHIYQQLGTTPVGNTYVIPLGNVFSFDYSVNPGSVDFSNVIASLTVTNLGNGNSFTFDPSSPLLGNAHSGTGYQNSERINFAFLGQGYDANLNDTFNIALTLTGVPGVRSLSVRNFVLVGAGRGGGAVPEPTTWAMMILGLGGVGATLRRSRKTSAAATA